MHTKITNLKNDGNHWSWMVEECNQHEETTTTEYATNENGNGIWKYNPHKKEWVQIAGFCDFSLAGYSLSGAREKLRRKFDPLYDYK